MLFLFDHDDEVPGRRTLTTRVAEPAQGDVVPAHHTTRHVNRNRVGRGRDAFTATLGAGIFHRLPRAAALGAADHVHELSEERRLDVPDLSTTRAFGTRHSL